MEKSSWVKAGGYSAFLGPLIFIIFTSIAAINYPGYGVGTTYLSDLGVAGIPSLFFNSGAIISGLFGMILAIALYKRFDSKHTILGAFLFFCANIGLIGVGIFNEVYSFYHVFFTAFFFILVPISFILLGAGIAKGKDRPDVGWFTAILGVFIFVILGFGVAPVTEHMSVVVIIIWSFLIGDFLFGTNVKEKV